jgi:hypothetical protein
MMIATKWLIAPAVVLSATFAVAVEAQKAWVPEMGFVPDSQTAIRIAEAVWIPIYGEKKIASEKPFRAKLRGETWLVEGSLPPGVDGGTAIAEISKRDGRILRVIHQQ